VEIRETRIFTERITNILSDDEYRQLQGKLVNNPEAGALIPEGQGLRKLRWGISGKGKRSGLRVIYYWYAGDEIVYMLFAYKKSEKEDLTSKQTKALIKYVKEGVL